MFLRVFVLLCLVLVSNAFVLDSDNTRNITKILTVHNGGQFGVWGMPQFCPQGSYAAGFDIKLEGWQGTGDDTELNAIRLDCQIINDGHEAGLITSTEGAWGDWQGERSCFSPNGVQHFLTAFVLKVESNQGNSDDTAANAIQFQCRDLAGAYQHFELPKTATGGQYGSFGAWSEQCPSGSAICGLATKVEASLGSGDDTALNDVKFYCCNQL